MTKREKLESVYCRINHIVCWDNKNLLKRQDEELDEALRLLKEVLSDTSDVEYEVFASRGNSDLIIADTYDEAIAEGERLSMKWIDTDVAVVRVEREVLKQFRNGGEVA